MSGIFGFCNLDGAPAREDELRRMAGVLERRGPDGTGLWHAGPAGLGLTLLATTPEALFERLPLKDSKSGCVITADVRLDNRDELISALGLGHRAAAIGDGEIILIAYLNWGQTCVERFLGDYAFAIWDPRENRMFCARDHFGLRPFNYHHTPGRFFAFASEPKAVLAQPQTPHRINEARIADFLVDELEGVDKMTTFFEEVYRLPPAHTLSVTRDGLRIDCYWTLKPGPELHLGSNESYAEAFLEVFTEAVRCRLRSAGPVGSMLSGGMDSGSVVAVARALLAEQGKEPLPTFSAIGPDPLTCIETRTILAALTMDGLEPHTVNHARLDELLPELAELAQNPGEPYDNQMTLVRAVYLAAHREGIKVVLDGVGGDMVLNDGGHIPRLLRAGHWRFAWREAVGEQQFWGDQYPAWLAMYHAARAALALPWARRVYGAILKSYRTRRRIRQTGIRPEFAQRVQLGQRLERYRALRTPPMLLNRQQQHAEVVNHPNLTNGRERYDRVAASLAIEPRDPFLDRRVVDFCLRLPGEQLLHDGWPKMILRRAMAGRLPETVIWRRGKAHLGWTFTVALRKATKSVRTGFEECNDNFKLIKPYVTGASYTIVASSSDCVIAGDAEKVYKMRSLMRWLGENDFG